MRVGFAVVRELLWRRRLDAVRLCGSRGRISALVLSIMGSSSVDSVAECIGP